MSSSISTEAPASAPPFACECDASARPACLGLPRYAEHEGRQYCVLHFPGPKDSAEFGAALKKKLDVRDFNFGGVWFGDHASFEGVKFSGDANFNSATFSAGANFTRAHFVGEASFRGAFFGGRALFVKTVFLKSAFFLRATFGAAADFTLTSFRGTADFSFATFNGHTRFVGGLLARGSRIKVFEGDDASLKLHAATVEPRDGLSFHDLRLRPHWFINVRARAFEFSDVDWGWRKNSTKREIACARRFDSSVTHGLLASACRDLAVNAEENHRYEEASRFRYMAMEARRLETLRGFTPWRLSWWYWVASGYGERVPQALAVFLALWLGFALLYTLPQPVRCPAEMPGRADCIGWETRAETKGFFNSFFNSAVYAIETMTLQKPEPRPLSPLARLAVLLCTVLGPVQAALLALAIRRKFMR